MFLEIIWNVKILFNQVFDQSNDAEALFYWHMTLNIYVFQSTLSTFSTNQKSLMIWNWTNWQILIVWPSTYLRWTVRIVIDKSNLSFIEFVGSDEIDRRRFIDQTLSTTDVIFHRRHQDFRRTIHLLRTDLNNIILYYFLVLLELGFDG